MPPVLLELEPAPEGVLLPGLELPPLPASPPEPGSAEPLVLAPLVPLGREELEEVPWVDAEPPLLPSVEVPLELVAAITGSESAQVSAAIAHAELSFLFISKASSSQISEGRNVGVGANDSGAVTRQGEEKV